MRVFTAGPRDIGVQGIYQILFSPYQYLSKRVIRLGDLNQLFPEGFYFTGISGIIGRGTVHLFQNFLGILPAYFSFYDFQQLIVFLSFFPTFQTCGCNGFLHSEHITGEYQTAVTDSIQTTVECKWLHTIPVYPPIQESGLIFFIYPPHDRPIMERCLRKEEVGLDSHRTATDISPPLCPGLYHFPKVLGNRILAFILFG